MASHMGLKQRWLEVGLLCTAICCSTAATASRRGFAVGVVIVGWLASAAVASAAVRAAASAFRPARRTALFVALLALFVVAIPGSAVAAAPSYDWTQQTTANSPSARSVASTAFDPATGKIVLFGGYGNSGPLADTWTYNGTDWTQQTTTHKPVGALLASTASTRRPARSSCSAATTAAAAFSPTPDIRRHGLDQADDGPQPAGALRRLDGLRPGDRQDRPVRRLQRRLPQRHLDLQRHGLDAADDGQQPAGARRRLDGLRPGDRQIVLFGGADSSISNRNDTWTYDGTDWTQQTTTHSPSARERASMAFDPATGKIVLFGGGRSDTWSYDGTDWTQQTTPTARRRAKAPRRPSTRRPARSSCSAASAATTSTTPGPTGLLRVP